VLAYKKIVRKYKDIIYIIIIRVWVRFQFKFIC